jgi:hypothetical protein
MVELLGVDDPKKLVPGDPASVWEVAGVLGGVGAAFEEIGVGFREIDDGGWRGPAADAFRGLFERQPKRFLEAADAFVGAAVALDSYAAALSWAQRQAGEAVALAREAVGVAAVPPVSLTFAQQAELTGVLVGGEGSSARVESREMRYAAAADTLRRALDQVRQVGDEAAVKVREASGLAPRGTAFFEAAFTPAASAPTGRAGVVLVRSLVSPDVGALDSLASAQHPDLLFKRRLDHEVLRDNRSGWEAGVAELRQRLRRLALDQLSPRLAQHLFVGHVKKRKHGAGYRELGYHHREGGVDRGAVRVVRVVAPPDACGVYRARIAGPRTEGGSEFRTSTFFPDSWSREDVLRAILIAFLNRNYFDERDPAVRRKWRGCARGVVIEGYVETQVIEPSVSARSARPYHVVTAYPIYRGGRGQGD